MKPKPWLIAYNHDDGVSYSRHSDEIVRNWMEIVRISPSYKIMLDIKDVLFVFRWTEGVRWEQIYLFDPDEQISA